MSKTIAFLFVVLIPYHLQCQPLGLEKATKLWFGSDSTDKNYFGGTLTKIEIGQLIQKQQWKYLAKRRGGWRTTGYYTVGNVFVLVLNGEY